MIRPLGWAIAVMLAGCVAQPPPPTLVSGIKTIGVISAIGDRLTLETVGMTAYGNVEVTEPVEWGIDHHVVDRIGAELAARYVVTPVRYEGAAFDKVTWPDEKSLAVAFRDQSRRHVADIVRAEVFPQGLDAYVVVTKATSPYGNSHQIVRGLGLIRGDGPQTRAPEAYALYDVSLVDGHKLVVIARAHASMAKEPLFRRVQGPYREVDASLWAASLAAMPEPNQQRLRDTLLDLIDQSSPVALHALGLIE